MVVGPGSPRPGPPGSPRPGPPGSLLVVPVLKLRQIIRKKCNHFEFVIITTYALG